MQNCSDYKVDQSGCATSSRCAGEPALCTAAADGAEVATEHWHHRRPARLLTGLHWLSGGQHHISGSTRDTAGT